MTLAMYNNNNNNAIDDKFNTLTYFRHDPKILLPEALFRWITWRCLIIPKRWENRSKKKKIINNRY